MHETRTGAYADGNNLVPTERALMHLPCPEACSRCGLRPAAVIVRYEMDEDGMPTGEREYRYKDHPFRQWYPHLCINCIGELLPQELHGHYSWDCV